MFALQFLLSGAIDHLMEYETERQRHNVPVMLTVDALSKLYGSNFMPLVVARTLGLQTVNALEPIKVSYMPNFIFFSTYFFFLFRIFLWTMPLLLELQLNHVVTIL
jgi:hypothetical protein